MNRGKKKKFLSCINGVRGAISLFLAVLMTPFLTIAMLLVETGRYNSTISILDEAMGVSSISTLANYDQYLHDRWGLMAISQDVDIQAVYTEALNTNSSVMGSAVKVNSIRTSGRYALTDRTILKGQLMEYSKLNAPTYLFNNFANLSDLVGLLEKIGNIGDMASLFSSGVTALDSGITLAKSAEALKDSADKLDGYAETYNTRYNTFKSKTNALIDTLKTIQSLENTLAGYRSTKATYESERNTLQGQYDELNRQLNAQIAAERKAAGLKDSDPPLPDSAAVTAIRKQMDAKAKEIQGKDGQIADINGKIQSVEKEISKYKGIAADQRKSASTAKTEYAEIIKDISDELTNFKTLMSQCTEALSTMQSSILQATTDYLTLSTQLAEKRKTLSEAEKDLEHKEKYGYDESDESYAAGLDYKISLQNEVAELETQLSILDVEKTGLKGMTDSLSKKLENYSEATIGEFIKGFNKLYGTVNALNINNITANTAKITEAVYRFVEVGGYIKADAIQEYLDEQLKEAKEGSLSALLDGLLAVYNKLMGLSIAFEANLDGCIDLKYYQDNLGGLPVSSSVGNEITDVFADAGNFVAKALTFKANLATFWKLSELWESAKAVAQAAVDLVTSLINFAKMIARNVLELFTYQKWWNSAYMAFNLPCRTDYNDATRTVSRTTMTNYTVSTGSLPQVENKVNVPIAGELWELVQTIKNASNGTGDDLTFTGAELEYILFGSNQEVYNQIYVFAAMYLIRVLVNIPSLSCNAEVQALAASATLGYPIVMALYYILEPLVQTVLLCNGAAQPLIPTKAYLAPSGVPGLIEDLVSICHFSYEDAKAIEDGMVNAVSKSKDDYEYQKKLADYEKQTGTSISDGGTIETPRKTTGVAEETWTSYKKSFLTFEYREYCFFLLMLTGDQNVYLDRLTNLIQMETLHHYQAQGAQYVFDLDKSYTFMSAEVNASVNQMMPALIDSSLFTVTREQYRGY